MDVDLRPQLVVPPIKASVLRATSSSSSLSSSDLSHKLSGTSVSRASIIIDLTCNTSCASANTKATSSPNKVSFKIEKHVNKLEKSSENLTVTSTSNKLASSLTSSSSLPEVTSNIEQSHLDMNAKYACDGPIVSGGQVSKDLEDEDKKKRPSVAANEEEPLSKKSKSAKLDPLFGSEDVDLRQLMPAIQPSCSEETAPPPPSMKLNDTLSCNENWDMFKGEASKISPKKSSTLDDVRAKLAKTAKLSKLSKTEKNNKELSHRLRLAELQNMNEDTQEANDEKIRTMVVQAQELLEAKSITQEQYNNLMKTVMSINEVNKLKIAKRRESLNAIKQKLTEEDANEAERNAAREAVLKKRIPKINKGQVPTNEQGNSLSPRSESVGGSNAENSPHREEKTESNDEHMPRARLMRDKRVSKVSKWGDRVVDPNMGNIMPSGPPPRPWALGPQNKRCFRGIGPHPSMAINMRNQWPINNINNGPIPPFVNGPMLPPMRGLLASSMPPLELQQPPIIPKPCNSIDNPQEDLVRTITIDGVAKEIRFYDQVAIVFMEVDQPREIGFQNGQRTIFIDNHEPLMLQFNEDYKSVTIDGEVLRLRFGFPSRELYIDEHWYEIYFGGPPITVPIKNKLRMLKAEGPPPQVNIGPLRRDLVVGKINMIVDAHNVIPLFLDARAQIFRLGDKDHTIQFADNLLTVLLDGMPTRVEYGGLPKSLFLGGKKYFVRFGALPQGIVAGKVQIKDMIYVEAQPPTQPSTEKETFTNATGSEEVPKPSAIESVKESETLSSGAASSSTTVVSTSALTNVNIDELFQKLVSTGILGGSSGILPAVNKIPAEGAVQTEGTESTEVAMEELIKTIDLSKAESVKTRQAAIVATLFSGMQCCSCGVRFPPEQTIKYSQHLDWHFRQNRRERDSLRKANSRKWYYNLSEWIKYEEIEDLEEREKNFFETQQNDVETIDETSNQRSANSPVPSCRADRGDVDRACDACLEKFEQFYDEDADEWYLRRALRIDDKIYHSFCYKDNKKAPPNPPKTIEKEENLNDASDQTLIQIDDDNAVDIEIKSEAERPSATDAPGDEEDDDVIVLPNEEPSVTEIDDDDDEYVPTNVTREEMGTSVEDDRPITLNETNESDVEIQEPNIPFTDLDTYEEKDLITGEESSQMSYKNVKIKEEPKEDEDEDDGFEDVGTVMIAPDEISIQSSEETQMPTLDSTAEKATVPARPPSSASTCPNEEKDAVKEADLNISMDGNLETGNEHNLSAAGPAPTVPLVSLVNKIKINITKNTISTNSTSTSNNATSTSTNTTATNNPNSNLVSLNEKTKVTLGQQSISSNPIPTISTIPVLCSGGTTIPSIMSSGFEEDIANSNHSVSTISVIGTSYGISNTTCSLTKTDHPPLQPAPRPIEETITYELKPALQKITLKKKEKIVCGSETSGLCSIM